MLMINWKRHKKTSSEGEREMKKDMLEDLTGMKKASSAEFSRTKGDLHPFTRRTPTGLQQPDSLPSSGDSYEHMMHSEAFPSGPGDVEYETLHGNTPEVPPEGDGEGETGTTGTEAGEGSRFRLRAKT